MGLSETAPAAPPGLEIDLKHRRTAHKRESGRAQQRSGYFPPNFARTSSGRYFTGTGPVAMTAS